VTKYLSREYAKAIASGVVAVAAYLAGVIPAAGGFGDVTVQQWLGAVVVLGAAYGVTAAAPRNRLSAQDLTEREADAQALQAYRDRPPQP